MDAVHTGRQRPELDELAPDGLNDSERELYLARGVASGDLRLDADALEALVVNLLATVEENTRLHRYLRSA